MLTTPSTNDPAVPDRLPLPPLRFFEVLLPVSPDGHSPENLGIESHSFAYEQGALAFYELVYVPVEGHLELMTYCRHLFAPGEWKRVREIKLTTSRVVN